MNDEYWSGALWVYQADITNDAMDAATQSYTITPGPGNEMEILPGSAVFNGDTVARTVIIRLLDGDGNVLFTIANISTGAALFLSTFSQISSRNEGMIAGRLVLSGTMQLFYQVSSVAVSQDSAASVVARIRGGVPTVAEAATAGVPVISINTERVF